MLQLGRSNDEVKDISQEEGTLKALAWVIRHFVPLIAEHPTAFWQSLLLGRPLSQYMTTSDLAFAVLVLEHHVPQWQYELEVERETGSSPTSDELECANRLGFVGMELFYQGGIAGEAAKQRFGQLNVYFFRHFFNRHCPQKEANMNQLEKAVEARVKADSASINTSIQKWETTATAMYKRDVKDDIFHRLFYYMVWG